jgi:ComF family protein
LPDGGARCGDCRGRRRAFKLLRSAGVYEGSLQKLIKKFKYGGREDLARPLGRMLVDLWREQPRLGPVDAVVPVPLHWLRERGRGYNQALVLAEYFGRKTGLPVVRALARRRSPSQTELRREERLENVRDAFRAARPELARGKSLLLVDDVCTTGATLEACARALKAAGARRVAALTVARQVAF